MSELMLSTSAVSFSTFALIVSRFLDALGLAAATSVMYFALYGRGAFSIFAFVHFVLVVLLCLLGL